MLSPRTSSRFPAATLLLAAAVALILLTSAAGARAQTNYPLEDTFVVTDANGHVVSGSDEVSVGQSLTVTAGGWLANSDVTLSFVCGTGTPVGLGTFKADAAGVLRADFVVPDVGSGSCALRLQGVGSDGNARSLEAPMRVRAKALSVGGRAFAATTPHEIARGASFGKTGADLWPLAQTGFGLLAVGAVLILAVRRSRRAYA